MDDGASLPLRIPLGSEIAWLAKHDAQGQQVNVERVTQTFVDRSVSAGDIILFVGPNGSGKSFILQGLFNSVGSRATVFLSGHRNISLQSADYATTPTSAKNTLTNVTSNARHAGRVRSPDPDGELRARLQGLVEAENAFNYRFRRRELAPNETTSPVDHANRILSSGGLRPSLVITPEGLKASVASSLLSVDQLSDGERAALLLCAAVVCADPGTTLFIDEPERHLNQSIARTLVSSLLVARTDISFVMTTHDLALAKAIEATVVYVVRGATPPAGDAQWIFDVEELVDGWDSDLGEATARAILGGRAKVLFTEGDYSSLDEAFYGNLFPGWEIRPAGGCANVIQSVQGLRGFASLHSVDARGLVDRDHRSGQNLAALEKRGVHAIRASSIESLLCTSRVIELVVISLMGDDELGSVLFEEAKAGALKAAGQNSQLFAARRAEWRIRSEINDAAPSRTDLMAGAVSNIAVNASTIAAACVAEVVALLQNGASFDDVMLQLPIKHSNVPQAIAHALGLKVWGAYTRLVLHHLQTGTVIGEEIRLHLRSLLPTLP